MIVRVGITNMIVMNTSAVPGPLDRVAGAGREQQAAQAAREGRRPLLFRWRYSADAACPVRPRLFYVFLHILSRIVVICHSMRHF